MSSVNALVEVTSSNWEEKVTRQTLPVLVEFFAPWCYYCVQMQPILEKFAAENPEKVVIAQVNTDNQKSLARKYRIRGIPQIILFSGGEVAERLQAGAVSEEDLCSLLQRHHGHDGDSMLYSEVDLEDTQ